jgi:hypothetical protein
MPNPSFYRSGEWNFICDLCGAKAKSGNAMKTWSGAYVCRHHREFRNPQDFLRGVKDDPSVPWTRTETNTWDGTDGGYTPPVLPQQCTVQGSSAIPALAIPGCMIPGRPYLP